MDPLLEALWNEMPEIQASDSLQRLRRTIHADLASAAGPDLADNLWALFDETMDEGLREAFRQGFGASLRLLERVFASPAAFADFVGRAARRPVPDYAVERMWACFAQPAARRALLHLLDGEDTVPAQRGFFPAMAIWGGSDPLMPADARGQLTALQPEVEAHIIRPAGHFPMETHSRALRDYLRGWLKYVG